jgi:hypothetical protein
MKRMSGHDQIDAGMFFVRKSHADIDDDPLAIVGRTPTIESEIHADFAKPPSGTKTSSSAIQNLPA